MKNVFGKTVLMAALALITASFSTVLPVQAADFTKDMLTVQEPWARGTAKSGGAFMTIHNMGAADELIDVRSDVAKKVQLHRTVSENGVMKMKHVDGIAVPAKGMAMLKPGSYHVMMMGLKKPLEVGKSFPLTLVFKNAGALNITVDVRKLGASHKMKPKN